MLLEADWVLPISAPPIAGGAVLVRDGIIEVVGPAAELRAGHPDESVRTLPGCVLMPGLVNAHTHLEYSAFRDFAPPGDFGDWMVQLLLARRKLDAEDYAVSALWGAHECARCGVTAIGDTSFEGWTVARAAGSAGLRARVYLEVFGLDDAELSKAMARLEERLTALQDECERAARRPAAPRGARDGGAPLGERDGAPLSAPMPEPGISPHAPYTVSARLYREVARLARRAGLRVATHVAESQAEVDLLVEGDGAIANAYRAAEMWKDRLWKPPRLSPVEYLTSVGALGPETLAVHCVQVDGADIALLAGSGAAVAHCPRSNARLRCGPAPVAALKGAGITVGLGTDSLSSNESLDMFAEMRAALAASRARASRGAPPEGAGSLDDATGEVPALALTANDVLRMATLEGARALGWEDLIGSLDKGKRADLISVRLPGPSTDADADPDGRCGWEDPVESLVAQATADDVRMVMVEGQMVFENIRMEASEAAPGSTIIGDTFAAVRAKLRL